MSTNEANIKITVDDSDLVTTDNRLERVENGLEAVAREGRQADASLKGVGRAALGAVGGLVSMELAKRALTGAINGLRASIQAFADTNAQGQRTVDDITASFTSMKAALGEAMIGGENAEQVVDSLNQTFDVLRQYIDDNSEAIAELTVDSLEVFAATVESTIKLVDDLRVVFAGLNEVLNDSDSALGKVVEGLQRAESTLNMTGRAFEFLRDRAEAALPSIEAGESRFMHVEAAADDASSSVLSYASSLVEAARISSQVFGAASNIGDPESPRRPRGRRDERSNQQQLLVQRREFNNNMAALFAQLEEQRQASKNLTAQNQLDQQAKEIEAKKQFLLEMATMEDEAAATRLAAAERQQRALEELRTKQTAAATSAASSLQNALLAITDKTGKQRKEALKKALGQELVQRGGALIAQGIGNAIALNPKGAFEIAGGASMVAAGAKLSGGGGGGRGGSPTNNTTPPAATNNVTNVTYNQSTQFGFVGDRRAAIKELEQINQGSQDRGL